MGGIPCDLTLVDEDDLPSVYLGLCEVQDGLLGRLFQSHHPAGGILHVVNQLLYRGVGVLAAQHAGGDIRFLPSKNLCDVQERERERERERGINAKSTADHSIIAREI